MPKDEKTPSADEIIEALALEMGVDEEGEGEMAPKKTEKATKATPPPLPVADAKKPEAKETEAEGAAKPDAKKAEAAPKDKPPAEKEQPRDKPKAKKKKKPAKSKAEYVQENIDAIFNVSGEDGDPYVEEYYDDGDDDIAISSGGSKVLIGLIAIVVVTLVGLAATYMAVPEDKRSDIPVLAKCYFPLSVVYECVDLQEQRRLRREAEERRRHAAWLDSLPKYGGLTVRTSPSYAIFQVDDLSQYVQHPSQADAAVETRSGTTFQNLDVTEHHVVVIKMNNFQERRIEVYPWGEPNTLWQQRQDDGSYFLDLNEMLDPTPEAAEELALRMTPSPLVPELVGAITVETLPAGAQVYYNGRLLIGEDGLPLRTPVTFDAYPPPPQVPDPVTGELPPAPERVPDPVTGELPRLPTDPVPVNLSREGVPIRIELEGYVPVVTGVYRHMFICTFINDNIELPFWERCGYSYHTGVIELVMPEVFFPAEEEGTGEGAETAEQPLPPG